MRTIDEIIVIGSGNWGLALAGLFSRTHRLRIWTIDSATARQLGENRHRPGHFYEHPIPATIVIQEKYTAPFEESATLLVMAVPSSQMRTAAGELAESAENPLVLSISKGFDVEQQCTMSEVIRRAVPGASVVVLTGPTIANEVAQGKPTRAVLACDDLTTLALVKESLKNDVIRFEISRNPVHHETLAALKGIVAIAAGMADGLDLGANMQGVIITEGLRELAVVASFFGIPGDVAYGVSGAGDLITTCVSPDSRNRRLGSLLAKGHTLEGALEHVRMTVEGVAMSRTIDTLWSLDVAIPLIHMVNSVLLGRCPDVRAALLRVLDAF